MHMALTTLPCATALASDRSRENESVLNDGRRQIDKRIGKTSVRKNDRFILNRWQAYDAVVGWRKNN
jgi:hypothetical protein